MHTHSASRDLCHRWTSLSSARGCMMIPLRHQEGKPVQKLILDILGQKTNQRSPTSFLRHGCWLLLFALVAVVLNASAASAYDLAAGSY